MSSDCPCRQFNFLSHGSQDLYPTYLKTSKGFSAHNATIATIIGNCGAISGGMVAGLISQNLGRRLTMILFILLIGCFIPLWILPEGFSKLAAGAFCVQFGVQGAWGIIPIFLQEISPPAFRGTFPGVAYQLGNMVSSAAAQIEATAGKHLKTTLKGKVVPDYAKIQGILIGVVAIWTITSECLVKFSPRSDWPRADLIASCVTLHSDPARKREPRSAFRAEQGRVRERGGSAAC